jgi:uncharacterized protein YdhG (YjbR/CyaY superfamily)
MKSGKNLNGVDEYIMSFPEEAQYRLQEIREAIQSVAPQAEEVISYQMPAYKYNGILVYFAGYKNHIGFYPTPSGTAAFKEELAEFKTSKAGIQFPIEKKIPVSLVKKIVKFRMKENTDKMKLKKSAKKK